MSGHASDAKPKQFASGENSDSAPQIFRQRAVPKSREIVALWEGYDAATALSDLLCQLIEIKMLSRRLDIVPNQHMEGRAMPTFIMLTRLNPDAVRSPKGLEQLERDVMKRVREECPDVEWLTSYAVLGPCDYLDVFIANDIETAARVSTLIRTFGHAQTEIWTATEWDRFKEIVRTLPGTG